MGPQAARAFGTPAVLLVRLRMDGAEDAHAGLTMYGDHIGAIDDDSLALASLLDTDAAMSVGTVISWENAHYLQQAMATDRDTFTAVGILMALHRVTRQQAFDLLRTTSQSEHRTLHEIAAEVAATGDLPPSQSRRPSRAHDETT